MEDVKIKLTVSWLFIALSMTANTILYFTVPGIIEEIMTGKIVGMQTIPELILVMAVAYFWIPLVMALLSVTLKDKMNYWINIIFGAFYTVFVLFELLMNVTTVAYPYVILLDSSVIIVAIMIVRHAWKWKRVLMN
jgi:hypothetical protein